MLDHIDLHPLDCQWTPILVLALVHLVAVAAASDVSVCHFEHRSYLYKLRSIFIFIRERQPDFVHLLLCELTKFWGFELFQFKVFDRPLW